MLPCFCSATRHYGRFLKQFPEVFILHCSKKIGITELPLPLQFPTRISVLCWHKSKRWITQQTYISGLQAFLCSFLGTIIYNDLFMCTLMVCSKMKVQLELHLSSALLKKMQGKEKRLAYIETYLLTPDILQFNCTKFMHMYLFIF